MCNRPDHIIYHSSECHHRAVIKLVHLKSDDKSPASEVFNGRHEVPISQDRERRQRIHRTDPGVVVEPHFICPRGYQGSVIRRVKVLP